MPKAADHSEGVLYRILDAIERVGNKLPHPFMLFVYLALFVIVLSWFVSLFDATVEDPSSGETVEIRSLVSGSGLVYMLTSMIENFVTFPPLGLVIVITLGIGLAQQVGLMEAIMKRTILGAPPSMVTALVIFVGICGNLASDAVFFVVPPLAGLVFLSLGRHPLVGIAIGFGASGAGYIANVVITAQNALLAGISTEAAALINEDVVVTPVSTYYFMCVSAVMLTGVGVLVSNRIVEPRMGTYQGGGGGMTMERTTPTENRGLRNVLLAALVCVALIAIATFVPGSPLRNEDGGLIPSPLLDSIVPVTLLFFVVVAVAYGVTVGKITTTEDVPGMMGEAVKDLSGFIILAFTAAQFISYFGWTNLGTWVSVNGAEVMESFGLTGVFGLLGYSVFVVVLSLLIGGGSSLWILVSPIFVPLFMQLNINPAWVQLVTDFSDSATNIVTPLSPYVAVMVGYMRIYDQNAGFGTLFSLMIPFAVSFYLSWVALFLLWYLLGLPIGPGESFRLDG